MLESAAQKAASRHSRFKVYLAVDDIETAEAQQLRYKVFAEEMGAWPNCGVPASIPMTAGSQ